MTSRHTYNDDTELADGGAHRVSLAHELAAAMMPEQSLSSRMLAEEFGLEFEDGADEGMEEVEEEEDGQPGHGKQTHDFNGVYDSYGHTYNDSPSKLPDPRDNRSLRSRTSSHSKDVAGDHPGSHYAHEASLQTHFEPSMNSPQRPTPPTSEPPDSLELLARNLQSTDVLIAQLRNVDADPSGAHSSSLHINVESIAATMIGRLNDMAREREQQARSLQDFERELRRISAEGGGTDALGYLDELECVEDLFEPSEGVKERGASEFDPLRTPTASRIRKPSRNLTDSPPQRKSQRRRTMQMEEEDDEESMSQAHDMFGDVTSNPNGMDYGLNEHKGAVKEADLPLHTPNDIPTPTSSIKQMAYFRSLTQSLGVSLTSLSEHAQVNGVNTADAGRKLRALKNKIVELKTDLDTADRSRSRIEVIEAGVPSEVSPEEAVPDLSFSSPPSPATSQGPDTPRMTNGATRMLSRRIDGRQLVEEQLRGFRLALADAAVKTEAIMAR
ncbi:hypothetical protein FRB97_009397 [Tulasnella sp. 331]|nr:hypothetical protein FRB97_009397 [Tulasnella sp. 331]